MIVNMRDVEPFNLQTVDNHQAGLFTKHLTGKESFSLPGSEKPKSMMIYSLKYNYPGHSFAYGYLLSVDINQFRSVCSSHLYATVDGIIKKYAIGRIELVFGGAMEGISINATPLNIHAMHS